MKDRCYSWSSSSHLESWGISKRKPSIKDGRMEVQEPMLFKTVELPTSHRLLNFRFIFHEQETNFCLFKIHSYFRFSVIILQNLILTELRFIHRFSKLCAQLVWGTKLPTQLVMVCALPGLPVWWGGLTGTWVITALAGRGYDGGCAPGSTARTETDGNASSVLSIPFKSYLNSMTQQVFLVWFCSLAYI